MASVASVSMRVPGCLGDYASARRGGFRVFGRTVNDELAVGHWWGIDRLLHQSKEQHSARPRAAPVEPEAELVQVRLQVVGLDRALMGAEQPAFGE